MRQIEIGDTVILNSRHSLEGAVVTILRKLPTPGGKTWEAVVVDGTARTWVMPEHIERKLEDFT